ncbi:MAG: DHH family phosphoesterase [Nitrososphaerota archaeon]|nr:DHH family phosphoesterase [Nitrososphaerota archaeon]MDG6946077.1 DHH family phosphoesterase [Nitrososphaerota archaeon]
MKAYCVSHRKDIDGLGSGSLAAAATGGEIILTDYDDMIMNLRKVPDDADRVVISDLGADSADFPEFLAELRRLAKHADVTYIDHHYLSGPARKKVLKSGVRLVHDVEECASMLTYKTFKDRLPGGAALVALCGAVTDYMDDSPMGKELMERADRHFVLAEATMLALALDNRGDEDGYPESLAAEMAKMKKAHEIPGVPEAAVRQLQKEAGLEAVVKEQGRKKGGLAYMFTAEHSTGNVAKVLIGAFDVPVGVALKQKQQGWYEVSLRGTSRTKVHLGRTISKIAEELGGSGGGHQKAAGCRIPAAKAEEMLAALSKKV